MSAVLLALIWPQLGQLWPLALVGFVPALIAQYRFLPRRIASLAIVIASIGYWLPLTVPFASVVPLPVTLLVAVGASLIWLPVMAWERRFSERTNYRWFMFQFPLMWTAVEVALGHNPFIGSEFWLAYRTAGTPELIQPVSVTSTPALTFLILLINSTVALAVLRAMDRRAPVLADGYQVPARRVPIAATVAGILAVTWVASSLMIFNHVQNNLGASVRVAALLTGAEDGIRFEGDPRGESVQGTAEDIARNDRLQALLTDETRQAAADGATLIVWPEEALGYNVTSHQGDWISGLAKETSTTIIVGYMPDSPTLTSPNQAAVWHPDGTRDNQIYSKKHPLIVMGEAFTPGTTTPTWKWDNGTLGVIICFDSDFPDSSPREVTKAGATLIAVPSLDPAGAENLRWQTLVFTAVSNRVPMVKSDIAFDATIVNAAGKIEALTVNHSEYGQPGILIADVNFGPADAPFTTYGGTPFAILIYTLLAIRIFTQMALWVKDPAGPLSVSWLTH